MKKHVFSLCDTINEHLQPDFDVIKVISLFM